MRKSRAGPSRVACPQPPRAAQYRKPFLGPGPLVFSSLTAEASSHPRRPPPRAPPRPLPTPLTSSLRLPLPVRGEEQLIYELDLRRIRDSSDPTYFFLGTSPILQFSVKHRSHLTHKQDVDSQNCPLLLADQWYCCSHLPCFVYFLRVAAPFMLDFARLC